MLRGYSIQHHRGSSVGAGGDSLPRQASIESTGGGDQHMSPVMMLSNLYHNIESRWDSQHNIIPRCCCIGCNVCPMWDVHPFPPYVFPLLYGHVLTR